MSARSSTHWCLTAMKPSQTKPKCQLTVIRDMCPSLRQHPFWIYFLNVSCSYSSGSLKSQFGVPCTVLRDPKARVGDASEGHSNHEPLQTHHTLCNTSSNPHDTNATEGLLLLVNHMFINWPLIQSQPVPTHKHTYTDITRVKD